MSDPKIEFRIWENSNLVGKSVKDVVDMGVRVYKVTRGNQAKNPPPDLKLEPSDYIGIVGDRTSCVRVIKNSKPQ